MPKDTFRVIPVLDVKDGHAVHAVGGIRSHYRPLVSELHPSSDPIAIARAYRDVLGLHDLYLADLDAIAGKGPDVPLYGGLTAEGLRLWIDPGIRDADDLGALADPGDTTFVIGLETIRGPDAMGAILDRVGSDRTVLSIDLFRGDTRLPEGAAWNANAPRELALQAIGLGVRRLLLLELSRVGTGQGTGTRELFEGILDSCPEVELAVGGGISGLAELEAWKASGASAVLVGTAFHHGKIGRVHLDSLTPSGEDLTSSSRPVDDAGWTR
jgi:phosphoribosylformimino-5-aminoimidazole carboxamide ribotide isomerase